MDLSVIVPNLFIVTNTATSQFFIKQGYLVLYEGIGAYNRKSGKFKNLIMKAGEPYYTEFLEVSNLLKEFRRGGREKEIGDIRNTIAGHIDSDYLKWYDMVSTLSAEILGQYIILFMNFSNKLMELCNKLLMHFDEAQNREAKESSKRLIDLLDKIDEITNTHNQKFPHKHFEFDTSEFRGILKSKIGK